MKIGLIRHFPVNQPFLKGWVTQQEVLHWFDAYNKAAIRNMQVALEDDWQACYCSALSRAKETAAIIYKKEIVSSELLNEPFTDPFTARNIKLPFLVWGMIFRFAILYNHSSQSHRKDVIEKRLKDFLEEIMSKHESNVLIVSHAFSMEILSRLLIKQGFRGKKLTMPKNGALYVYEKKA